MGTDLTPVKDFAKEKVSGTLGPTARSAKVEKKSQEDSHFDSNAYQTEKKTQKAIE